MEIQMKHGKLTSKKAMRATALMCWAACFMTYLGRLDYAACLVEISASEGWTKAQAGLIATGFFATYGIGQLMNGVVGDKISPKLMVAVGLGVSGLVNLLFPLMGSPELTLILWCINGFAQSMIWSPMVRMLSEWLPVEKRLKACVHMCSTVPAGTLTVYGLSAALIWFSSWKVVFFISGVLILIVTVLWLLVIHRLEQQVVEDDEPVQVAKQPAATLRKEPLWKLALAGAIPICCIAAVMQGMLKDGVTTWIPTFLGEQFHLESAAAILSTTIVPIINLGGAYLASWLIHKYFKNEVKCAGFFFGTSVVSLGLLIVLPKNSAVVSLLLLALTTTFMMSVNTCFISMMPSFFVRYGVTSTISGILNSATYLGSAFSSYFNGAVVDRWGWDCVMQFWAAYAVVGLIACAVSVRKWRSFRANALACD